MAGAPLLDEGVYSETIESLSDTKFRQNFEQNDSVIIPWLYLPGIAEFRSH